MTIQLTNKETATLIAIVQNGYDQMGGKTISELRDDNFSWFNLSNLMDLSFSKNQISGLISALMEKGLIDCDEDWFLTDFGLDTAEALGL